jgi:two-component system, LytTR family, response regulator
MPSDVLRAIIVDDEPLARRGVRQQLERHPSVRVIAECATGAQAARAITTHDPDIVFLDIQMPGGGGFDVVEAIGSGGGTRPAIIFVTAYSEHAVRAFEVNALDYILKPIDDARFDQALTRARTRLETPSPVRARRRIAVHDGAKTLLLNLAEIDWLEAAGNYVRLHVAGRTIVTRGTLQGLNAQIADPRFLRVHRSRVVNSDAIVQIETAGKGLYVLGLRGGAKVDTSYHYRSALVPLLERR